MKKRYLFIFLILTIILFLTSCPKNKGGNDSNGGTQDNGCVHEYSDWTVKTEPTCTVNGEQSRQCALCSAIETQEIAAEGHNYVGDICQKCGGVLLNGGLFDADGNLIATWDTLTNTYGLDVSVDYLADGGANASKTPSSVLSSNSELAGGVKLEIKSGVTAIGAKSFFDCGNLTEIVIPDTVKVIGNYAFQYCDNLTKIIIPDSVTSIGEGAFYGCEKATQIQLPRKVEHFGDGMFWHCKSVASITLPEGVTSIGFRTFLFCENLSSLQISNTVISIGEEAFTRCLKLTELVIPDSVKTIDKKAFYESNVNSISIGKGVNSISENAFDVCWVTNITVDADNEFYKSVDGNLYTKDGKTLVKYAIGKSNSKFTVPDGVVTIGKNAFYMCSNITSVVIPNSVIHIDEKAFWSCGNIASINIGVGVKNIGDSAFYSCDKLDDIYYAGSEQQWNGISIHSNCNSALKYAEKHYNN